jgi:hypothetical protein
VPVPIRETHAPNSNRTVNTSIFPLSEGWLLGLDVLAAAGSPSFGQVWACLELVRGREASAQVLQAIAMGFITTRTPLIWPGGANLLPLDGPGHLRSIAGTTPAAGADISETVPTGARWEAIAFGGRLTTSATVANRFPRLTIDDGGAVPFIDEGELATAQTASQAARHTWREGLNAQINQVNFNGGLPVHTFLLAGSRIRTVTTGIQVGDQWDQVQFLVREWLTGE